MIALLEKNTNSYLNNSFFIYKRMIYLEEKLNLICNFSEKNYKSKLIIITWNLNIQQGNYKILIKTKKGLKNGSYWFRN